ncbi:MAG: hypothetical protein LBB83_07735 [Treponema sp.]|jgi:protoporphyrinogen oxidase|nr:hypothetical protein [Treponema sp.]
MNYTESSLESIVEDIAILRMQLMSLLTDVRKDLDTMRKSGSSPVHHQEYQDLVERLNSARAHLYVAGEYLRGNGEWAALREEEEEDMLSYINQEGA